MSQPRRNGLTLPIFLILAVTIPTLIAAVRLFELSLPADHPLLLEKSTVPLGWLALHGATSAGFLLVGALQILPGLRSHHRGLHRRLGKLGLVLGTLGATTGLWLTLRYPEISGPVLYYARLAASLFWLVAMAAAFEAIRARNWRTHGAWMLRAYAMALPAGTLPFVLLPFIATFGDSHFLIEEWIQALSWPLHLAAIEWLRSRPRQAALA